MSDVIISIENLGKKYRITHQAEQRSSYKSLREVASTGTKNLLRMVARNGRKQHNSTASPFRSSKEEFWALKKVSFNVEQGEVLGIIGRNGAGKSTLLKILSRITEPSEGRISLKGRVASLLEVGTGFHPELTGRENIYLNGAVMGMSKAEIRRKFDEIVAFAEVEKFLDTPVKRYSSGMYVRLAFAVAAHLESEILIVDEVLAVGDAEFQKKCLGKMQDVTRSGRTVLFVSHNMAIVKSICSRAVWLNDGQPKMVGPTSEVMNSYLSTDPSGISTIDLSTRPRRINDGRLRLRKLTWLSPLPIQHGEPLRAQVKFRTSSPIDEVTVGIGFSSLEGTRLLTYETDYQDNFRPLLDQPGEYTLEVHIDSLPLAPALYLLDVGCRSGDFYGLDYLPAAGQVEVLPGPKTPSNIVRQDAAVRLASTWRWHSLDGAAESETSLRLGIEEAKVPGNRDLEVGRNT